jgi:hypothetical protein
MPSIINATTTNGLVTSADNSGEIQLQSNGTTGLTMNTNEGIQILNCLGVGNATPSTSGAGITFPATQSASSDANTLDDYEEGTFTPNVVADSGSNGGLTSVGRYTKIGRLVYLTMNITGIAKGTLSGQLAVVNLPFAVADTNTTGTCRWQLNGTPPAGTTIICPQSGGGTGMELQCFGGGGYLGNLGAGNVGSSFDLFNITYIYNTNT